MPLAVDEKKYGRLLAKHLPAVIESDEQQDRLAELLMHLTIPARTLSPEESRLVTLLGHLVEEYEERATAGKAKRFSPVERLKYLMEENGLQQSGVAEIFGGQSVGSAVLNGKRRINLAHARKLSRRFGLSIAAFIAESRLSTT